jgi:hypothetical protein
LGEIESWSCGVELIRNSLHTPVFVVIGPSQVETSTERGHLLGSASKKLTTSDMRMFLGWG